MMAPTPEDIGHNNDSSYLGHITNPVNSIAKIIAAPASTVKKQNCPESLRF
jgi:hypothetical protein